MGRLISNILFLFILAVCLYFPVKLTGQDTLNLGIAEPRTRILFVFDASQSMADRWQSDSKFNTAVRLLTGILDSLNNRPGMDLGLRVYGPKRSHGPDCKDSYLMVPLGPDQTEQIRTVLKSLAPHGTTPIAFSLEQAVSDFSSCPDCRNVVVLVTDGLEACGGDPCRVSYELQKKGIFLRPFIVGIGKNMAPQFRCMGRYFDAALEKEYHAALQNIVKYTLHPSTAQVNLLDEQNNPNESNIFLTFYDRNSGRTRYSFMHTLNEKGLPDTLLLDPLIVYDIVAHTIPPVRIDSVCLNPGEHTPINIHVPQGYLQFSHSGSGIYPCIIRREGRGEAIHVQQSDQAVKYLAGNYDITVLTTPRMNFEGVSIAAGRTSELHIPSPGVVTLVFSKPVSGCLLMEQEDEMLWIENIKGETIPQALILQPGRYRVAFRPLASGKSSDTRYRSFQVNAGENTVITIGVN